MAERFDYIIIGAGSAGCVLANRLTADGRHRVCLLEAGPPDINPFIHIPAGFMKTLTNPTVNWCYQQEPSAGTDGRIINAPRGKTLGGSSSINGLIFNRGQAMDFDVWAQRGNRGWGYADVLPYFMRLERRIGAADERYRGRQGELAITDLGWQHPLCEAFIEAAVSLGIPRNPDYNGASQEGVSYVQRTTLGRRRMSAARAFLNPARKRANLRVITAAQASRILVENGRATGVTYHLGGRHGSERILLADREVVLCGGAVNSPQLLQCSGIGPAGLLNELGIPLVHDLPGVGENLRDHYAPRFTARVKNISTINESSRGPKLWWEIAKYFAGAPSIVGLGPTLVYAFWHSDETVRNHDLQLTFTPASYHEGVQSQLDTEPGFTIAAWQQRPESRGFVRARSADPFDSPRIQPNYLAEEEDRRVLLAGMKLSRRLMRAAPLARYFDYEAYPGEEIQGDDALLQIARERGTTTYHLMGTCRMGPKSDPLAVVDDQLRLYGLQGLRVADASVMPTMLSANLNAGALMIGEKAADMILGRPALAPAVLAPRDG